MTVMFSTGTSRHLVRVEIGHDGLFEEMRGPGSPVVTETSTTIIQHFFI